MRDTLKNETYFEEKILENDELIKKYEDMLQQLIQERGENDPSIERVHIVLLKYYTAKINCLYSAGFPIDSIKEVYPLFLNSFEIIWEKETSSYIQLLWTVSLGILVGASKEQFQQIEDIIKKEEFHDYLIDYLMHQHNKSWEITTQEIIFPTPYQVLKDIIRETNKDSAVKELKYYLEKEWYKGHDDAGWHDSHKSKFDTYSGYWSYESGAIAKVLQLDDEALKNVPYYPYDLVHYKN
ncbi:PoNi-like cognate immunity protein [Listeria booriae]|uniref:DUF1911 domain-containing protein n=1 Tax=Listeria booriae TaxID=1552123 RepID=A0A7X1DKN1_9LIST|nr:PoNi-like cognate immunity protein [Listeria booriae]MBC2283907.1 DUF1911 domain-containing protein [Listeria booriae]MBC2293333.1 DUF1911 domain-containing protein [Listeria booriae]MBC2311292.1 DUF1911 domain-containing protein [Listeria booriae]